MAELVDARDSNSRSARSVGSIHPGTEKASPQAGLFSAPNVRGSRLAKPAYLHHMNIRLLGLALLSTAWESTSAQITVNQTVPQGGTDHVFQNLTPDLLLDFDASGPGGFGISRNSNPWIRRGGVQDIGSASFTAIFTFDNAFLYPEVQATISTRS